MMHSKIAVLMSRPQFVPPWRREGLRLPPFLLLLCLLQCLLFVLNAALTTAVDYTVDCSGATNDSSASFGGSLRSLLSSLVSLSSTSNAGSSTAGGAYGLYMCQGDLSPSACSSCVQTAVTDISQACAGRRSGIIWYEFCELRYSDADFFGVPVTQGHKTSNPLEDTSSVKPFEVVSSLAQVAPLSKPLMFASNVSDMYPLFAQAQCSSDLSADGCRKCLTAILELVKICCTQRKGWRYFTPSCWIRYEPTPFFGDYPNATNPYIVRSQCSSSNFLSSAVVAKQANLRSLLSDLKSKAPSTGFYNTSVGADSGKLYGLALCAGDLATPSEECGDCLETAGRAIMDECPNKTEGYMWYAPCFLKYSEQSFFGVLDDDDDQIFCGTGNTDQVTDDMSVRKAQSLVQVAATNPLLFAAGKVVIDNTTSTYLLLQCTRDLSSESCQLCLEEGINKKSTSCKQTKGWQYLSGSCTIRCEAFLFFNETAASRAMELPPAPANQEGRSNSKVRIIAILLPILGVVAFLGLLFCCSRNFRRRKGGRKSKLDDFKSIRGRELTFIDLPIIQASTDNFSDENKLGEGGFGPVYKGVLQDGTEIAVKRLSQESNQGATEFKNEMKLIAKIQHKNLVRMLGCCVEGGEKLLIYEYLPNKSLDSFLFDPKKRVQLDWERRFLIISGITKGLLYLHEDSPLKVIHRDVKSSNVLLDNQMNPKISDFGMAKIFAAEEATEVNTRRIVGTYGYMAPEYAMYGIFSVKSDVFSYGVLLLEIISGEKNGTGHFEQHGKTLLRRAWDLWNENKAAELIDPALALENASSDVEAALKCIHIGLLCVQENAEERPAMSAVILMLRTDGMALPEPGQPPNFAKKGHRSDEPLRTSTTSSALGSINEVTETGVIIPR